MDSIYMGGGEGGGGWGYNESYQSAITTFRDIEQDTNCYYNI